MSERPADEIRRYVIENYIQPARRKGNAEVNVVAREVLNGLNYSTGRAPAVCSAMKAKKFLSENHLVLQHAEGPPKMQSVRVTYTYRLLGTGTPEQKSDMETAFLKVRGIAKEVFQSLGGGEAFLRAEREKFYPPERKD